jgi:hypothetical protein
VNAERASRAASEAVRGLSTVSPDGLRPLPLRQGDSHSRAAFAERCEGRSAHVRTDGRTAARDAPSDRHWGMRWHSSICTDRTGETVVMLIRLDPADAYHEGGHAAMFWHYHIPLEYVSFEADLTHGYGGVTVPMPWPAPTGQVGWENEMRIAAAGCAAKRHIMRQQVPRAAELITGFEHWVAEVDKNPNPTTHHDMRNFVIAARARDEAIRDVGSGLETGPASWVPIWRDAELLIRGNEPIVRRGEPVTGGKLWSAAEAVANWLIAAADPRVLNGEEAAALMSAAMEASGYPKGL